MILKYGDREIAVLETVYNGNLPEYNDFNSDKIPIGILSTVSHYVCAYIHYGGSNKMPVFGQSFNVYPDQIINFKTGEILSKEESKTLMEKEQEARRERFELYQKLKAEFEKE